MAKNQSLPAHLQEKDSRGEDNLATNEYHEKPTAWRPKPSLSNPRSTNDIVWAFYVGTQYCLGSSQNRVLTIINKEREKMPVLIMNEMESNSI